MSSHVRYEVRDRIATITLDRAEKRNAMTYAMLGDFIETVERAGADEDGQQQREPDVEVPDVRQLVADDPLQLLTVELLQEPGRDRNNFV